MAAGLAVSIIALIVAAIASRNSLTTSDLQTELQTRVTTIEEDRRADELARQKIEAEAALLYPGSSVHAWTQSGDTPTQTLILVQNTSNEPIHDGVVWAWPMLLDGPEDQTFDSPPEFPDFPDFPRREYLWMGSIGPGDRKAHEPSTADRR